MKKVIVSTVMSLALTVCYGQTVSFGTFAGTGGNHNTIFGYGAAFGIMGDANTIIGHNAGNAVTLAAQNTFIGYKSGYSNTAAVQNHFVGYQSGYSNTIGYLNHFEGHNSGYSNTTGSENQFIGLSSGYMNSIGTGNLFIGYIAGRENTTASYNQFMGNRAGWKNTIGSQNFFSGYQSGYNNISGSNNYFSGYRSGFSNVVGSGNVFVGNSSGYYETGSNKLYVDNSETTSPLLYGDFAADYLSVNGNLGIGVTPTRKVDVLGRAKFRSDGSTSAGIWLTGSSGTESAFFGQTGLASTDPVGIYHGGNWRFVVNQTGNVGIGTTNPASALHVEGGHLYVGPLAGTLDGVGRLSVSGMYAELSLSNRSVSSFVESPTQGERWVLYSNGPTDDGKLRFWSGNDKAVITKNGYLGIGTTSPQYPIQVVNAYSDGNTWYNVSDKNMKENFVRIKQSESILDKVIDLPIQYWNYKGDNGNRHIGPTAQDFYQVFGLGKNEKAISTVDETGVALAAIQELGKETRELKKLLGEQQQLISSLMQSRTESIGETGSGLKLYQNQPNPFQRDTKITMEIPREINQADLYIYDLQGKIAGKQNVPGRGVTTITVEGGSLNSGMYLYVLIGDGRATEAKRMILTE